MYVLVESGKLLLVLASKVIPRYESRGTVGVVELS
jgi:hypothetical protein